MEGKLQLSGQATVERLSRRSTLIFVLLALVAVFTYFLLAGETADERASAAEINLAGKRRMLSQRIGLLSSQFLHQQKAQDLVELSEALHQIASFHDALMRGDLERGIRAPRTAMLRASYDGPNGVDALMQRYLALGKALLQTADEGGDFRPIASQLISMSQGEFLDALDKLVDQYQQESEASTDTLRFGHSVCRNIERSDRFIALFFENISHFSCIIFCSVNFFFQCFLWSRSYRK